MRAGFAPGVARCDEVWCMAYPVLRMFQIMVISCIDEAFGSGRGSTRRSRGSRRRRIRVPCLRRSRGRPIGGRWLPNHSVQEWFGADGLRDASACLITGPPFNGSAGLVLAAVPDWMFQPISEPLLASDQRAKMDLAACPPMSGLLSDELSSKLAATQL